MNKTKIITLVCLGVAIGLVLPSDIFATTTDVYGAKEIAKIGNKLKDFMFEVAVPYAGGIFGGINTIKSFMSNNYQSMGIFAMLTASSFIVPPFLNGVFGSSMLLP
jgi:hypothetical protein